MTNSKIAAIATGAVLIGGGGYLIYAYEKKKWPFSHVRAPNSPSQPPIVHVNVIDQNTAEASVTWSPVPNATYYKVFVDGQVAAGADNVTGTSVTLRNLVPGQTYQIAVAACN